MVFPLAAESRASHCNSVSCWGTRAPGLSGCGLWAQQLQFRALEHRLNSCGSRAWLIHGLRDAPRPWTEPVSPALAGGFPATEPSRKPPGALAKQGRVFHLEEFGRCFLQAVKVNDGVLEIPGLGDSSALWLGQRAVAGCECAGGGAGRQERVLMVGDGAEPRWQEEPPRAAQLPSYLLKRQAFQGRALEWDLGGPAQPTKARQQITPLSLLFLICNME